MTFAAPEHTDVLILGGGFAGTTCARRLERLLPKGLTITLVSDENYFVFQPLLPEVVGASLDPDHVISPLRHLLKRTRIVLGTVEKIALREETNGQPAGGTAADPAATVTVCAEGVGSPARFTAGHLVLALGSVVDVGRIPGMAEHAFLMKNVADALALRHGIIGRLERAVLETDAAARRALLTFVVVGGGFSGIETAAEINDLLRSARRFFPTLHGEASKVVCVHARDQILPELDPRLGKFALERLQRRGIEFRLQARTRAVSAEAVYLQDGERLETRTIVCTVGNAPHPVLQGLGLADEGRLRTDEFMRLQGRGNVWALGDCACVPDGCGGVSPPTAQFASRQGDVVGRNIAAAIAGGVQRAFKHKSLGQMATLGHHNAVASMGRVRISGFLAWWLWRTIYLLKLPRLDRKLRVVIDWTLNLFFPRDINALDIAKTRGYATVHLEAGETLFRQGDPSAAFYVIESGTIELVRRDAAGTVVGRDTLGPGSHLGEGSLLHRSTRTTTATATAPCTVLVFAAREFATLTRCFSGLRRLLEATSRRFQPASAVIPHWVPPAKLRLPVGEVMSTPVFTLPQHSTLRQGLSELLARRVQCFPLVDGAGQIAGWVASSDLFAALRADVDLEQPLSKVAASVPRCLTMDQTIESAVEVMRRHDLQHVVVIDSQRRVVGIVSIKDILKLVLADAPQQATEAASDTARASVPPDFASSVVPKHQ